MRLSAPLYRLKRRARLISREQNLPLSEALDLVARTEGHARWSLLAARVAGKASAGQATTAPSLPAPMVPVTNARAGRVLAGLVPGDTLLLAARPGQGKTILALDLLREAGRQGRTAVFFSLFYAPFEAAGLVARQQQGGEGAEGFALPRIETPDVLDAAHVEAAMGEAAPGSLVVIDYLQLLARDEGRAAQAREVAALARLARERGFVVVILSQVKRGFDPRLAEVPGPGDIAEPAPEGLGAFTKALFLHEGRMRLVPAA